jgi:hypothetical protein
MKRIGERAMSGAERQAKYRARLAREPRRPKPMQPAPAGFEHVPSCDEILAMLGLDPAAMTVALGGQDSDPDGSQSFDEFGEPIGWTPPSPTEPR